MAEQFGYDGRDFKVSQAVKEIDVRVENADTQAWNAAIQEGIANDPYTRDVGIYRAMESGTELANIPEFAAKEIHPE